MSLGDGFEAKHVLTEISTVFLRQYVFNEIHEKSHQ